MKLCVTVIATGKRAKAQITPYQQLSILKGGLSWRVLTGEGNHLSSAETQHLSSGVHVETLPFDTRHRCIRTSLKPDPAPLCILCGNGCSYDIIRRLGHFVQFSF